jgi:hypothetical protein
MELAAPVVFIEHRSVGEKTGDSLAIPHEARVTHRKVAKPPQEDFRVGAQMVGSRGVAITAPCCGTRTGSAPAPAARAATIAT